MGESKLKFSGDVKTLEQSYRKALQLQERYTRRIESSNARLRDQASKNKRSFQKANQASFGADAISGIKSYIAAFGGVTLAVTAASKILDGMNEKIRRGVQGLKELEPGRGRLATIAGPQVPLSALTAETREIRLAGGVGAPEAQQLEFTLRSLGLQKDRGTFAKLFGIEDPAALAQGAFGLKQQFPQLQDTKRTLGLLFAGAAKSPVSATEFAPLLSQFAQSGAKIGGTPEELVGLLSLTAGRAPSADVAATRLRAFSEAALKKFGPTVASGGVLQTARNIEAMRLSPQRLLKKFGRTEAATGFGDILAVAGEFGGRQAELQAVTSGQVPALANVFAQAESDKTLALTRRARRAEQRRLISEEDAPAARAELLVQARRDEISSYLNERVGNSGSTFDRFAVAGAETAISLVQTLLPKEWEPAFLGAERTTDRQVSKEDVSQGVQEGLRGQSLAAPVRRGDRTDND